MRNNVDVKPHNNYLSFILILTFLQIIPSSEGQTKNKILSGKQYNGRDITWFKYEYDYKGKMIEHYCEELKAGTTYIKPISRTKYSYDQKGNKILNVSESWRKNNVWVTTSKTFWEYDKRDSIISIVNEQYAIMGDTSYCMYTSKTKKHYDKKGRLISSISTDDGKPVSIHKNSFEYDKSGLRKNKLYEHLKGAIVTTKTLTNYIYDSNGKIITEDSYDSSSNIQNVKNFKYNKKGKLLTEKHSTYKEGKTLLFYNIKSYEYDSLENMISEIIEGKGKSAQLNELAYDKMNRRISATNYELIGQKWSPQKKIEYTYDGDLIEARYYEPNNDKWKISDKSEYFDFGFMNFDLEYFKPRGNFVSIKYLITKN